ncbi:MAG: rod-binding protein [Burkholderiaceae bacterium]
MTPAIAQALRAAPAPDRDAQLHHLSRQLEGVFLNQLFQAMRASVPQDGLLTQAPGQEMFTQLFDERMAAEAADHMQHGLSEALYRQLAGRLAQQEAPKP